VNKEESQEEIGTNKIAIIEIETLVKVIGLIRPYGK